MKIRKRRLLWCALILTGIMIGGGLAFLGWLMSAARQDEQVSKRVMDNYKAHRLKVDSAHSDFGSAAHFAPWQLSTADPGRVLDPYLSNGYAAVSVGAGGQVTHWARAGRYQKGNLLTYDLSQNPTNAALSLPAAGGYQQELDLRTGMVTTRFVLDGKPQSRRIWLDRHDTAGSEPDRPDFLPASVRYQDATQSASAARDGATSAAPPSELPFWRDASIEIEGDPEAQQMVNAAQFYLLTSIAPELPLAPSPLGLLEPRYKGHLFWDGDLWMLPAVLPQHPTYARALTQFRLRTLAQAKRNAAQHGMAGAEFAWESDSSGYERAPTRFLDERHVNGAVAWGAWQVYAWTGDRTYLQDVAWPLLQTTAQYWTTRAVSDAQGGWHIRHVIGPDEVHSFDDDDVYTNALVRWNLRTAMLAARLLNRPADPRWQTIAARLVLRYSLRFHIPASSDSLAAGDPLPRDHFLILQKQASVVLMAYPLHALTDNAEVARTLDFYAPRTDPLAPAMSDSVHSIIAAQLGRNAQAWQFFRASYRPYLRTPWAMMAENAKQNRVPFLTGMGGCLQSVLYGFAGLRVFGPGEMPVGTRLVQDGAWVLCASPHLPSDWKRLTLTGLQFRHHTFNVTILPYNRVVVTLGHNIPAWPGS